MPGGNGNGEARSICTPIGMGLRDGFAMRGVISIRAPLYATDIPSGFLSRGGICSIFAKPIKAICLREKH
jgi:hypothetical protein